MSDDGDCKIGRTSKDPSRRLKQLQTASSKVLTLSYSFETRNSILLERMLHMHYRNKRKLLEWFELDADDVAGFGDVCEKLERRIVALSENDFINKKYDI